MSSQGQVKPSKKKKGPVIAVLLGVVVTGGLATWLMQSGEKLNPAMNVVSDAAKTRDYQSVVNAMNRGELTQEQVTTAVRKEFEAQTLKNVNDYFDTKDPKAKLASLDRAIDDLERFRHVSRGNGAATRPGTTRPASRPSQMQTALALASWAMSQPPDTRARLAEYRVVFDKRRSERGMPGMFEGGAMIPLGQK